LVFLEKNKSMTEFDVVILGGGLSGTRAALRATELGGKVCLIEKGPIGKKGFMRRNILLGERDPNEDSVEWYSRLEKQERLAEEYCGNLKSTLKQAGVVLLEGEGSLASSSEISVQGKEKTQTLSGKSLILACGCDPSFPSTLPREENVIVSIDEICQLKTIPKKVLVVGAGKWAAETALGFQKLGCKVFLCVNSAEIIPEMDPEFNLKIDAQLKSRKIKILPEKKIISFFKNADELEMTLETGIKFTTNLIVMVGEGKGGELNKVAESIGARLGSKDEIFVDDRMMSSIPNVYGVGSISGKYETDMMSQEQGKVAAENAMGKNRQLNREWVPEINRLVQNVGYVGCSMKSAPQQGFHPVEGVYESKMFEGEIFKIVADKRTKMVVGAQIISSQAAELIPMILLLIKKGTTVPNLANSASLEMTRFQEISCAAKACLQAIKSQ
jgi:dihydrolipoamide dehydrogenase